MTRKKREVSTSGAVVELSKNLRSFWAFLTLAFGLTGYFAVAAGESSGELGAPVTIAGNSNAINTFRRV